MYKFIITHDEAKVLSKFREGGEAGIHELAWMTLLSPTELASVLESMHKKGLVETDKPWVKLTADGLELWLDLKKQSGKTLGITSTGSVMITNESARRVGEDVEIEELERSLDKAISESKISNHP